MLLLFKVFVLYLSCEKNENRQKEAGFGPFKKKELLMPGFKPGYSGVRSECNANCATTIALTLTNLVRLSDEL